MIHGDEVVMIEDTTYHQVTPTLEEIYEATPGTELEDIERILAHEDKMDAEANEQALHIKINILHELPPQEITLPCIIHNLWFPLYRVL